MTNKTILISGGTSGVGKAIAKSFAKTNATIVLVGRNETKAQQAVEEISRLSSTADLSYIIGDLADAAQNKKVATTFMAAHSHLDVLFNSAGNIPKTATNNIDVNLRSHYWLTKNLTPALAESEDARVFIITGMPQAITWGPIYEHQFNIIDRGLWLLTHKTLLVSLLANELRPQDIKVNAFFPGGVQSDLLPWTKNIQNESLPIAAELATNDRYRLTTGQFFDDHGQTVQLSEQKYSQARAKRILQRYL